MDKGSQDHCNGLVPCLDFIFGGIILYERLQNFCNDIIMIYDICINNCFSLIIPIEKIT